MRSAGLLLMAVVGCGEAAQREDEPPPPDPPGCLEPELTLPDGTCLEVAELGECPSGFAKVDGFCEPQLVDCPPGQVAFIGEPECHELTDCGSDPWGGLPDDPNTRFVDGSFDGGFNDGSRARPFTTIKEAIVAVPNGGTVAVTDGSYVEQVQILGKVVQLVGRCPSRVEIVAPDGAQTAVSVGTGASGTILRGVAITGAPTLVGIGVQGSDVTLEQVWIHDVQSNGLAGLQSPSLSTLSLTEVLVERVTGLGVATDGVSSQVTRLALREVGIAGLVTESTEPGVTTTASDIIVDAAVGAGISIAGVQATMSRVVVRNTQPLPNDDTIGFGISLAGQIAPLPTSLSLDHALVTTSAVTGIAAQQATLAITSSILRGTVGREDMSGSAGVGVRGSELTLTSSLVEDNGVAGLWMSGSTATVDNCSFRDQRALPVLSPDQVSGVGVTSSGVEGPNSLAISRSILERNTQGGLIVMSTDLVMDGVVVRDTAARVGSAEYARGAQVQTSEESTSLASFDLRNSKLLRNGSFNLLVIGSPATATDVTMESASSVGTDLPFGDNLSLESLPGFSAAIQVVGARLTGAERAGLSSFGASVTISSSTMDCNAVDISAGPFLGSDYSFADGGGNTCGCGEEQRECKVSTAEIAPPTAADPL